MDGYSQRTVYFGGSGDGDGLRGLLLLHSEHPVLKENGYLVDKRKILSF